MNDRKVDEILKNRLKKDTQIPNKRNELFKKDYSINRDINNQIKMKKIKGRIAKQATIIASLAIVVFTGGSVYAHVNGIETPISELLRRLGINSGYEQNATEFNETIANAKIEVKLLNAAIDNTSLIIGYEFSSESFKEDAWIDVYGTYTVNNLNLKPLSQSMDKDENGKIVLYQVFDINEMDLKNTKNVNIVIEMSKIQEYKEVEDLNCVYKQNIKEYEGNWNFRKSITVTNSGNDKEYEFEENAVEILPNINVSIKGWVEGSYTNMLKIKTDKTNYNGDDLDKYYKILDSNNSEIAICKEEKEYDHRIYTERAIFGEIPSNSKLKVEVYSQKIFGGAYEKVSTIDVDLTKAKEKVELDAEYTEYSDNNYEFKYNKIWKNEGFADANKVGPQSIYLGSLQIQIPSTSNSEYGSTVSIITKTTQETTDQYVEEIVKEHTEEGYIKKSIESIKISGRDGYKVILEIIDGEEVYKDVKYITVLNGKAYMIDFFGTAIEYNNLQLEIEQLVDTFNIR